MSEITKSKRPAKMVYRSYAKNPCILIVILMILLGLHVTESQAQQRCGVWRWPVKTLTDDGGEDLLNQAPIQTSIDEILRDVPPQSLRTSSRSDGQLPRFESEQQLVMFSANIIEIKHEGDKDYHLVLSDPVSHKEMVGEIPDPNCPNFAGFSNLKRRFKALRNWVDHNAGDISEDGDPSIEVQIEGIKFWDEPGHATGSPPNGREIHPITDIITSTGSVVNH